MESKAGSILLSISGILTILVAVIFLILAIVAVFGTGEGSPLLGFGILFFLFIVLLVLGILKLWASKLMKFPETTMKGGIVALIVGILTSGDLLAITGGILGIVQANK